MVDFVLGFLKINDVKYEENRLLRDFSPVKIGGIARLIVYPENEWALIDTVRFLENKNIQYKILGRMSNVLPPDDEYTDVLIKTDKMSSLNVNSNKIYASAGVCLPYIAAKSVGLELSGIEELSGIPGSIGGAICGNAGAFGREISEIVSFVRCYDVYSGEVFSLPPEKCCFAYRDSIFKNESLVILGVELSLTSSTMTEVRKRIYSFREKRMASQPVHSGSLGSTFKRTSDGVSAAYYIDRCGLKGYSIGDAQVSLKHAGFIVNTGSATARDYLLLMNHISDAVKEQFKVELEPEIKILN